MAIKAVKPKVANILLFITISFFTTLFLYEMSWSWYDETHLAIAKAAGLRKWYNAAGADMQKVKAETIEKGNHYANNPPGTHITPEMVLSQTKKYDQTDLDGHLYGAIIAAVRNYLQEKNKGKYGEYHLAFCAHYVGDLSQPLHNIRYNSFNRKQHQIMESLNNEPISTMAAKIKIYPLTIHSEADLAQEIARIANLSLALGYKIEAQNRLLTVDETYLQLSHSASLLKAILDFVEKN